MPRIVDYFLAPVSPWTYLGHERLAAMAAKHGAQIRVKPMDLGKIFPKSGGLALKDRAPQRQAYRLAELARWRDFLGLPIHLQPKHFPVPQELACRMIVAARQQLGEGAALRMAGGVLKACWVEERDVSEAATLQAIAREQGFDAEALGAVAATDASKAAYDADTDEALAAGVFGSPTYRIDGELYWGQDRLDFVERALARG